MRLLCARPQLKTIADGSRENPFDFWYQARLADAEDGTPQYHSATILVDCESSGKVELTGSGAGITTQVTCTDPD